MAVLDVESFSTAHRGTQKKAGAFVLHHAHCRVGYPACYVSFAKTPLSCIISNSAKTVLLILIGIVSLPLSYEFLYSDYPVLLS